MNDKGVFRTAPATQGLLKNSGGIHVLEESGYIYIKCNFGWQETATMRAFVVFDNIGLRTDLYITYIFLVQETARTRA